MADGHMEACLRRDGRHPSVESTAPTDRVVSSDDINTEPEDMATDGHAPPIANRAMNLDTNGHKAAPSSSAYDWTYVEHHHESLGIRDPQDIKKCLEMMPTVNELNAYLRSFDGMTFGGFDSMDNAIDNYCQHAGIASGSKRSVNRVSLDADDGAEKHGNASTKKYKHSNDHRNEAPDKDDEVPADNGKFVKHI